MAGKAEARITPMITLSTLVHSRLAKGSIRVKGRTPRIEIQIRCLRP